MLLEQLWRAVPTLKTAIMEQALVKDREEVWLMLRQLMQASAPVSSVTLPGAILDQVTDIAATFGLADRLLPRLGGKGCAGIWLGVEKPQADLHVVMHMDQVTFRPRNLLDSRTAEVVAMSGGETIGRGRWPARAMRYDPNAGRLKVLSRGLLSSGGDAGLPMYKADRGTVSMYDMITVDMSPSRQEDRVSGSGLDNAAGVLIGLAAAGIMRHAEETMLENNRRCHFIFPGTRAAAEFGTAMSPTLGTVILDSQMLTEMSGLQHEAGVGYSLEYGQSGAAVPMNYQQVTLDLAASFGESLPSIAQFNQASQPCGHTLSEVSQVLGVMGPPISKASTFEETVNLIDIQTGIAWMSCFIAVGLNLVPEINSRYALGR